MPSMPSMPSAPPAISPEQYQQSADETAEELICPITFELPVDPVTAEDGRVYERRAIEEWLARPGAPRSPSTNEPMGRRLLPARQVRNAIERVVRNGILSGPRAESWEKKIAGEKEVAVMRKRAEDGANFEHSEVMEWHKILFAKGWIAPNWPEEVGGPGWDVAERSIFQEECVRANI